MEELCDEKFLKEEAKRRRESERAGFSSQACVPWQGTKLARLTSFWDRYVPIIFLYLQGGKKELMERIRGPLRGIQGTSILGRSGTGKTNLARWAHNQAKSMDYEQRAYVHILDSMDKREFLFEILKQVGKQGRELKDMVMEEVKTTLIQKLAEAERFLIVLDGVKKSNETLLRELAMIIPFFKRGHIIYTTQDDKIALYLNTFKKGPVRLKDLDDVKRQELLAWQLHREFDGQRLTNEEKRILNSCPPRPLHLSLLGGFLSNAGEQERAALAKDSSMTTSFDILPFSCHKLPVHLKPCFIYMTLFPVSFPIPTRRLVRLWLAEGLLDSHCYNEERKLTRLPEDVGETFILELADRNVIDVVSWRADGSPKACHMVIDLHEMIYPIAMSMGFLHINATRKSKDGNYHDPTSQKQQLLAQPQERNKIRWLAEHTNIVADIRGGNYPNLSLSHVRSFLSFYLRRGLLTKDIGTFLRKMASETDYSLLRVLDLEGVYKPTLQGLLPKLVLLRYLGLRSTVLDSLPRAVADLHHLETLDIKHTNVTSLPSSLWKSRNLRHLHLNWFYIDLKKILKACSSNVMALTQLQTLSGLVIGEVKENSMKGPMNILTTLTTLKLFLQHSDKGTSGAAGKAVADWISFRLNNLQSLTFGVIQEPKPAEEAEPAEKPRKVAEPVGDAKSAKDAKPTEEAKPKQEAPKVVRPVTSQMGPLPELSLVQHHELLELYLLGRLNNPIWTRLLPDSLRVLTLSGSKVKTDMMRELGNLLRHLRTLRLLANSFLGTSLSFATDGFPSLKILKLWKLPQLERVIIEHGAMPHLQELEFRHLQSLENVTGIDHCTDLEITCVIFQSHAPSFVDQLKGPEGKVILSIEKDPEWSESMDDNEDIRDEEGETSRPHIERDSERTKSVDEDDSHDDNGATASH